MKKMRFVIYIVILAILLVYFLFKAGFFDDSITTIDNFSIARPSFSKITIKPSKSVLDNDSFMALSYFSYFRPLYVTYEIFKNKNFDFLVSNGKEYEKKDICYISAKKILDMNNKNQITTYSFEIVSYPYKIDFIENTLDRWRHSVKQFCGGKNIKIVKSKSVAANNFLEGLVQALSKQEK